GLLPLISATLAAEQDATFARAAAAAAAAAADRAQSLAVALEHARADASALNAELRHEQHRKDEFLAMLGHELRNPLAPLVTSIEMLRVQGLGRPAPEGLVGIMARQTAQLSRLVDDLLDVARVSQGKIELQRAPLRLADAVTGSLEQCDALISARRHRVEVLGADLKLYVLGDRARLVQVFGNLLNNSAKYTDPGGKITVTLAAEGASAIVQVTDTGIGIAPEMQPRVFDAFTQAPVALARAQGGLGIGLTLVRTLVQLHDGRISVESPGIGHGSTFSVVLPLVEAPNEGVRPFREAGTPRTARALRVLIVDDNNDAADSLAELVREMGHHVEVAYTATSALKLYSDTDPDLALLDIGLPDLDGYELARRLRHIAKPGARFVALTGYEVDNVKKSRRESSFDEHTVKPITIEALENLLAETARARS
ncbi:MAG: hybrid sensor histidine kinase/response regulator, partial [Casimicrobiaceae bacterium]